ncbi:aldehyde dehydrogenase family protein [Phytohabitans flavus]|uniref:Aldehyde dehydrogenase n=1 Tax=Phytohabitans flavus TaxID=1076124 RepID=A0A6F8XVL8_9ACTN|nr:aldehyde dehydrogenase family protein [Phytohabitans flavus]BCB77902.1 aldehyde dehydrogenase [Phytohabitans flavus]
MELSVPDGRMFVGGEWVAARGGETIAVLDPATGKVLRHVPRGTAEDVDAAVRAAHEAFPVWRDLGPTRRGELMRAWAAACDAAGAELATTESMEVGRPYKGPSRVGATLTYMAGAADKVLGTTLPTNRTDMLGLTLREPYGVCGCIVPWNTPATLMIGEVAPAIAAGNTVVVKPAEDAPLTCLRLAALAVEAGIPPGVVNVVTGYGPEAGAALPEHPLVRYMAFTGSPETGSAVMRACARNLVPLHLELGGKSPQVVMADADLDRAVPTIVRWLTTNAGQVCFAGTRLLVQRPVRDEVVDRVAEAMRAVRIGPWFENVDMGPLISAKQRERVLGYVAAGLAEGARLVTGGGAPPGAGFFVEPTLFDQVDPGMRIAQEEIFGPVLSAVTFDDAAEALRIANGTRYGLAASVWTANVSTAVRFARGLEAGQVYVNTYGPAGAVGTPFGGYRGSGFGRTGGAETILERTQVKSIVIDGS